MKAAIYSLVILAGIFTASYSSAGGVVNVLKATYKPLMQSRNGRIENCGIHFSLAGTANGKAIGVQGSLNEHYFENKMPSISFKIMAFEARQGQLVPHQLTSGFLQGKDFTTTSFFFNTQSSETGSWLAMTDFSKRPNLFSRFILSLADRPWVGFNIGDGKLDFTMQLPAPKDRKIFNDLVLCSSQALGQFQKEIDKAKNN